MNAESIVAQLKSQGYSANLSEYQTQTCIEISIDINGDGITLLHFPKNEYSELPKFYIKNADRLQQLAHVELCPNSSPGTICVNDKDSVSVNYERPHLANVFSLDRHIDIIRRVLIEPAWNRLELLREFYSHWSNLCGNKRINLVTR